jgi:hypothetical protein
MIAEFCEWLASTPLSQRFQDLQWFVPMVQTIHIFGIAVVVFSIGMLAFRLLGLSGNRQSLFAMAEYFLAWVWSALAVLLFTGILLTITEPARELLNHAFRLKMVMVAMLAIIAGLFQLGLKRNPTFWTSGAVRRRVGRSIAISLLILSVCIVAAGRWIAYI